MTDTAQKTDLPLSSVRVVELTLGTLEMCGRFLSDLGAQVILIEPSTGLASRQAEPLYEGHSLHFATHNANKQSVELDLDSPQGLASLGTLIDTADIFLESTPTGWLESAGIQAHLRPDLVTLSMTAFGRTGPYTGFKATNAVMMGIGGVLARSGIKGHPPLLPPGELAYEAAAMQAAWLALSAYWNCLNGGSGGFFDFSIYEATLQILDPGMGVTGSAAGGRSALELAPRGRPPVGNGYPIFPCKNGAVRICLLNPRQWQGMSAWLGDDHPFIDPTFSSLSRRFKVIREINAVIAEFFRDREVTYLVSEGQARGVPIAAVACPETVLRDAHFVARQSFVRLNVGPGIEGKVPFGYVEIDGHQAGIRKPAPPPGQADALATAEACAGGAKVNPGPRSAQRRPFAGIRVLDLGVIVAGAELGRLLADQGAQVIKVESTAYPDGLRQSLDNQPMSISFAQGSRGKKSLGLNLRDARGVALFKELAGKSDVVLSNFKPGTLESLGIGYESLRLINPGLIMADSSALGNRGPLSNSLGYGPLVRASTGLTWLWRYPDMADGYSDSTTIFPDHFAARISAAAIAAMLARRLRTGAGGRVSVSQAETILGAMSTSFLHESLQPGTFLPCGNRDLYNAPSNVFACAGDDEWCVVSVENSAQWRQLCLAIGKSQWLDSPQFASVEGRRTHAAEIEAGIAQWTGEHSPLQVREILQSVGVPAANMLRLDQMAQDPQLIARRFFRTLHQPGLSAPVLTENALALGPTPEPLIQPAPFLGQHTAQLAQDLLGIEAAECQSLVDDGVLQLPDEQVAALLAEWNERRSAALEQ